MTSAHPTSRPLANDDGPVTTLDGFEVLDDCHRQTLQMLDKLTSLLSNLNTLAAVLAKDQHQLQQAVINLGQFSVNIANVSGSGPWLNLLSATAIEPDNILKACGANPNSSNGPCG